MTNPQANPRRNHDEKGNNEKRHAAADQQVVHPTDGDQRRQGSRHVQSGFQYRQGHG